MATGCDIYTHNGENIITYTTYFSETSQVKYARLEYLPRVTSAKRDGRVTIQFVDQEGNFDKNYFQVPWPSMIMLKTH